MHAVNFEVHQMTVISKTKTGSQLVSKQMKFLKKTATLICLPRSAELVSSNKTASVPFSLG